MSNEIFGWFNFDDIYLDAIDKCENGANVLEIGCFFGKSTEFLCRKIKESKKDITVYVIDTFDANQSFYEEILKGRNMYEAFEYNLKPHLDILKIFKGDSKDLHHLFEENFFDMIFIDGDHEYNSVKNDLQNYYSKLKKGGIFAGHDYTEKCGVPLAVNEFSDEKNLRLSVSRSSWILQP